MNKYTIFIAIFVIGAFWASQNVRFPDGALAKDISAIVKESKARYPNSEVRWKAQKDRVTLRLLNEIDIDEEKALKKFFKH